MVVTHREYNALWTMAVALWTMAIALWTMAVVGAVFVDRWSLPTGEIQCTLDNGYCGSSPSRQVFFTHRGNTMHFEQWLLRQLHLLFWSMLLGTSTYYSCFWQFMFDFYRYIGIVLSLYLAFSNVGIVSLGFLLSTFIHIV